MNCVNCALSIVLYSMYVPVPVPVRFTILGDVANSANKQINTCSVYDDDVCSIHPIQYLFSQSLPSDLSRKRPVHLQFYSHFPPKSRLTAQANHSTKDAPVFCSVFMRYHSLICTGRRVFQQICMSENSCHRAHIEFSSEGDATATAAALTVI